METIEEPKLLQAEPRPVSLPVSVIIPVRNEARNLPRCLESLRGAGEIYVIDSGSTDETVDIARSFDAKVVQFHYHGGWPKKRQWAMDTLPLAYDWILLLDADEVLTPESAEEIRQAVRDPRFQRLLFRFADVFPGTSASPRRCQLLHQPSTSSPRQGPLRVPLQGSGCFHG